MSKQYFTRHLKFNLPDDMSFYLNGMDVEYVHAPYGSLVAENGGGLTKNPKLKNGCEFDVSYWFDGNERGDSLVRQFFLYNGSTDPRSTSRSTGDNPEFPEKMVWFYQTVLKFNQEGLVYPWKSLFTMPLGMEKYYDKKHNKWKNRFWISNLVTKFGDDNKVWLMCESISTNRHVYYIKLKLSQSEDENTCYIDVERPVKS